MTIANHSVNGETATLNHLVGGNWVAGPPDGETVASTNPAASAQVVANHVAADVDLAEEAIDDAANAQASWDRVGLIERGLVLRRAAVILEDRAEEIATLLTIEEGKTLPESRGEVGASVETLYHHAAASRDAVGSVFPSSRSDELIRTVRRPVGTVAVITPWNFPVQIPVWKIAPALLWGNTVVWKSAGDVPAISAALAEVFVDAGAPPGVLNLVLGPGPIGAHMVASPRIGAVTFTGSVPVGRQIAAEASRRGAKVQLEMGGHNAAVVLPDVAPGLVADTLISGAMGSTGQKCTATRRIIAVGSAHDALVEELATRVEALKVGDGREDGVEIGPLIAERARREVEAALEHAVAEGAQPVARTADVRTDEAFVAPTLLTGSPQLRICNDEVFGPVTTVLEASDLDHAIDIANGTEFGLTASIFTADESSVRRFVDHVDAGLVKANAPTTGSEIHVPFGGLKDSSFPAPREQNAASCAEFFTWTKSAYLRTAPSAAL